MNHYPEPPDDVLLAYLRGELDVGQIKEIEARLRTDAALAQEWADLQAIAVVAQEVRSDQTSAASLERFHAALRQAWHASENVDGGVESGVASETEPYLHAPRVDKLRPVPQQSFWQRFQTWMRNHSTILEPALLAIVIAQGGVIAYFAPVQDRNGNTVVPVATMRGTSVPCNAVVVTFKDGVTEKAIRDWLLSLGAHIGDGPDDLGQYRIMTRDDASRDALLHSADTAKLIASASAPDGCKR